LYNSEYIELIVESRKLFFACKLELANVFDSLKCYEMDSSFKSKKIGIYKYIKKLIPCFNVLLEVSYSNSIQSLITLQRMIVDNYAILYLLTTFSTKEEQLLRYYLYLLDATHSHSEILDKFSSNLKSKIPDEAYKNAYNAKTQDNKSSIELIKIINEEKLDLIVNKEIISKSNWKFKDANEKDQNKNQYKWIELYSIARIPNHHAQMLQNYHSAFVHGLGISLMIENDKDVFPFTISTTDFCSILMSLIIKIIITEFKEETKNVKLNQKTIDFANGNWNNWK